MRWLMPLSAASFALTAGCEVGSVNPEQDVALDVSASGAIGLPAQASVYATSSSIGGCHEEHRDLFDVYSCTDVEDLGAKITSVSCEPADACGSVILNGKDASWVSLTASYDVTVVADGDGIHRTKTVAFTAFPPEVSLELTDYPSDHALLAGQEARFCLAGADLEATGGVTIEADLDGTPIAPASIQMAHNAPQNVTCVRVSPPTKGTLHAVARLTKPNLPIARVELVVHDFTEPFRLEVADAVCGSTKHAYARYDKSTQKWRVALKTSATFDVDDTFPIGIPKLVFRDAARERTAEAGHLLELDLAPTGKATVEASFGSKTAIIEVRDAGDDERTCN